MKKIALWSKQKLRSKFQRKVLLNVDYMLQSQEKLVLSGWVGSRLTPLDSISWLNNKRGVSLASEIFKFPRPDVISQLGFESDAHCFGFIVVISDIDNVANLSAIVDGAAFPLAKQKFSSVTSANIIAGQAAERGDYAMKFIRRQGVTSGEVATTTAAISLDPEIMKIQSELATLNLHAEDFVARAHAGVLDRVQGIWKKRINRKNDIRVVTYGEFSAQSVLSIIVPIYGRYDFVLHQIASFSRDEAFRDIELIYVLDDPTLTHEFVVTCEGVYNTFNLPFKVVLSSQNLGFAGANNLGVAYSSSEKILLLNSDILPVEPGWTTQLLETFNNTENIGILGAVLLYEDESVQHLGMEFRRDSSHPGLWLNHHPSKGMPWDLVKSTGVHQVQLATGACMLMNKALFQELGGFDPLYVLGDFEDSDLCLKVIDKGLEIYVDRSVTLYHLERLSQGLVSKDNWKTKLTMLNSAYQLKKWETLIEQVVEK